MQHLVYSVRCGRVVRTASPSCAAAWLTPRDKSVQNVRFVSVGGGGEGGIVQTESSIRYRTTNPGVVVGSNAFPLLLVLQFAHESPCIMTCIYLTLSSGASDLAWNLVDEYVPYFHVLHLI